MARPLRIEYAGAIYHVMSRGNVRQKIFLDDEDREKMLKDLGDTVVRYGWELFSFCLMPNHFHLFFRTPRPNLSRDWESVWAEVIGYYGVDAELLADRGNGHIARAVAAWLARRLTSATLRELAVPLGLGRPESVSNLTRRIDRQLEHDSQLREALRAIELKLLRQTKNKV